MLLVAFLSAPAAAQSGAETAASAGVVRAAGARCCQTRCCQSGAGRPGTAAAVAPSADSATVAGTSNIVATPLDLDSAQPGTAEIPPANPADASQQQPSPADSQSSNQSSEVMRYQAEQSGLPPEQPNSLDDGG